MAGEIVFSNGMTLSAADDTVLDPAIVSMIDQAEMSFNLKPNMVSEMGYVSERVLNPNAEYSAVDGAYELDEVDEGDYTPELEVGKGADKGFKVREFKNKIKTTRLLYDHLMASKPLQGADSTVLEAFRTFAENYKQLRRASMKKKNYLAAQLWTQGWGSSAANGPGSPTPYGVSLFSDSHPYELATQSGTFGNILGEGGFGTADTELNDTQLQAALNIQKAELRLHNGDFVDTPGYYCLITSRQKAVTARNILNTTGNQVGIYSGDTANNNANVLNKFSYKGNLVELIEIPSFGQSQKDGDVIGSNDHWFVLNKEHAREARAMRHFILNSGELIMWVDEDTDNIFVKFYESYAYDHYGLESFIVGSKGTVSA